MKRGKGIVGLLLLCALAFCAFSAPSASALPTTAAECTKTAGEVNGEKNLKDFSDEHCDNGVTAGTGTWGHLAFAAGVKTEVSAVNDLTGTVSNFLLAGKLNAIPVHIQCTEVKGTGSVTNEAGPPMKVAFGQATTTFNKCSVTTPASAVPCTVTVAQVTSVETGPHNLGLGAEKEVPTGEGVKVKVWEETKGTEMGLKFSPPVAGGEFTNVTLGGEKCPAGFTGKFPVKGFAYAEGGRGTTEATKSSGATAKFTPKSTLGGLTFAGSPAFLEGTLTFRKTGGNPLTLTTTAT